MCRNSGSKNYYEICSIYNLQRVSLLVGKIDLRTCLVSHCTRHFGVFCATLR